MVGIREPRDSGNHGESPYSGMSSGSRRRPMATIHRYQIRYSPPQLQVHSGIFVREDRRESDSGGCFDVRALILNCPALRSIVRSVRRSVNITIMDWSSISVFQQVTAVSSEGSGHKRMT
jgi:hypothetical protein